MFSISVSAGKYLTNIVSGLLDLKNVAVVLIQSLNTSFVKNFLEIKIKILLCESVLAETLFSKAMIRRCFQM